MKLLRRGFPSIELNVGNISPNFLIWYETVATVMERERAWFWRRPWNDELRREEFETSLLLWNWQESPVSKASKYLKTGFYIARLIFLFSRGKTTTMGKKSENICSSKKQPKPEISTCKKDTCFAIRDTEKRLSLKIYRELPEGLEAFIQREKWEEKAKLKVSKTQEYAQTMPNREWEELSHLRTVQWLRTPTAKGMHLTTSFATYWLLVNNFSPLSYVSNPNTTPNLMSSISSVCHGIFMTHSDRWYRTQAITLWLWHLFL